MPRSKVPPLHCRRRRLAVKRSKRPHTLGEDSMNPSSRCTPPRMTNHPAIHISGTQRQNLVMTGKCQRGRRSTSAHTILMTVTDMIHNSQETSRTTVRNQAWSWLPFFFGLRASRSTSTLPRGNVGLRYFCLLQNELAAWCEEVDSLAWLKRHHESRPWNLFWPLIFSGFRWKKMFWYSKNGQTGRFPFLREGAN